MRYSGLKVITEGLFGNKGWKPAWRDPAPKAEWRRAWVVDRVLSGQEPRDDQYCGA